MDGASLREVKVGDDEEEGRATDEDIVIILFDGRIRGRARLRDWWNGPVSAISSRRAT